MTQPVSDARSNANEQIAHAAKVVGRSPQSRKVFEAIYTGKKRIKSVRLIMRLTGLDRKQVLTHGKKFVDSHIVNKSRDPDDDNDNGYEKDDFYHRNKNKILSLAGKNKKLAEYPTKRTPKINGVADVRIIRRADAPAPARITVDEIDSFSKLRKLKPSGNLPTTISEKAFKHGVRKILGETGSFTDWGGEKNDLYSTRLMFGGKRRAVAFGFKGPGTKGPLVPGKLGKNGDQIQRLFETDADVFIIQYWREIEESVVIQMYNMAVAKSTFTRRKLWYGIIDGQDSNRLLSAYPKCFTAMLGTATGARP